MKIRKRAIAWICSKCGARKTAAKRPKCSYCKVKMVPVFRTK